MFRIFLLLLMLTNFNFIVFAMRKAKTKGRPIILRLHSDQIVDTFESIMSSAYIQKLAKDFAARAADHLIEEIKNRDLREEFGHERSDIDTSGDNLNYEYTNKKHSLTTTWSPKKINPFLDKIEAFDLPKRKRSSKQMNVDLSNHDTINEKIEITKDLENSNTVLNESEAYALLKAPLPDGDNQAISADLSDLEEANNTKNMTVIHLTKINGRYFRRLLAES